MKRKYLPTIADLIDRLTISQMKSIFINKEEYDKEIALIVHDLDLLLKSRKVTGRMIQAIVMVTLCNREIWLNESKARLGGNEQDHLLKFTHSINGVRNTAKNIISNELGERKDLKIDCFAAEFAEHYGNWNIWKK